MVTDRANKWHAPMPDRGMPHLPRLISAVALLDKTRLILCLVFVLTVLSLPLVDPDYFWHLKTGEYIVSNRMLPSGDVFSYTRLGQHWTLHEWLFEVLLYGVFAAWGTMGVKLLTATFLLVTLSLLVAISTRIARHAGLALCVALTALIPLLGGIAPRPQLVTYAFFTAYLFGLLQFKYGHAKISLFMMPCLMILWVNAHGGYAIGIALLAVFAVCEWLTYWMAGKDDTVQRQRLLRLTKIGIATVLASLANPGFLAHWLYPFQVIGLTVTQVISEWQSPNFHQAGSIAYLILVLLFFAAYAYDRHRPDATELIVPGIFMFAGFFAFRHTPLAAIALTPFTARALAAGAFPDIVASWRGSRLARWFGKPVLARELGRTEFVLNWLVLLAILAVLASVAPKFQARQLARANEVLPVGAADFVLARGITGKMFNDYDRGGYLIYRLAPARKVFIDSRADLYGDQFVADFLDIYNGKANWKEKFNKLSIDYAILHEDAPIRQLLKEDADFKEVYFDQHYAVLLRRPLARATAAR